MPLPITTIAALLKEGGPGAYTTESVKRAQEIVEDLIRTVGKNSRELANMAGKQRVTEEEIKVAAKYIIKI